MLRSGHNCKPPNFDCKDNTKSKKIQIYFLVFAKNIHFVFSVWQI